MGNHAHFLPYSPLWQLKIWEQNQGPVRWRLTYPYAPLRVCVWVWVCVYVSQSFIRPSHQISSRDTHIHFWTEVKTVPLARTGEKKQNFLSGRSIHWQKNPMCTCSNRFWVILSLPAFGWHKKATMLLHLFYNSVNTKLSLVAMINTHMHIYLPIHN